ncbi:hypothetical protein DPEC_G00350040 [Dallia pectoralis]|uniref:Uncharacterized protein n=1 Tax=Dallia pectoralis TaxID=75939 RepID=A0ACC2F1M3_DALPE|nr:hypothetical protein DPEC_G00350040 [Dallia pectoralis]
MKEEQTHRRSLLSSLPASGCLGSSRARRGLRSVAGGQVGGDSGAEGGEKSACLAVAHCPAVISVLPADTWDQSRGSSGKAAAWQLALISFSSLRNSSQYTPLT